MKFLGPVLENQTNFIMEKNIVHFSQVNTMSAGYVKRRERLGSPWKTELDLRAMKETLVGWVRG